MHFDKLPVDDFNAAAVELTPTYDLLVKLRDIFHPGVSAGTPYIEAMMKGMGL